jgi:hypothetical protein
MSTKLVHHDLSKIAWQVNPFGQSAARVHARPSPDAHCAAHDFAPPWSVQQTGVEPVQTAAPHGMCTSVRRQVPATHDVPGVRHGRSGTHGSRMSQARARGLQCMSSALLATSSRQHVSRAPQSDESSQSVGQPPHASNCGPRSSNVLAVVGTTRGTQCGSSPQHTSVSTRQSAAPQAMVPGTKGGGRAGPRDAAAGGGCPDALDVVVGAAADGRAAVVGGGATFTAGAIDGAEATTRAGAAAGGGSRAQARSERRARASGGCVSAARPPSLREPPRVATSAA